MPKYTDFAIWISGHNSTYFICYITYYFAPMRGAKYSDEYVCVCVSVCLSVCPRGYLWNHMRDLYQFLSMLPMALARSFPASLRYVMYFRFCGWHHVFFYNGPYCGMNFATKDWFRLNLHIYGKSDLIPFLIIKGHNFDYLFRTYSQIKIKEKHSNLTINGKNNRNARHYGYCYYGIGECQRTNKWCMNVRKQS